MKKIAIIGTNFGSTLAKAFSLVPSAEVVGMAGKDFENTKNICRTLQNDFSLSNLKPYKDWKEMVDVADADLIVIASPTFLHKEMFEYIVPKDKHILVEKTPGISVLEVTDMINFYKKFSKKGQIVAVDHEMRFNPVVHWIRNQIITGNLGEVTALWVVGHLNLFSNINADVKWYRDKDKGGGQILLYGSHLLDLARYVLDQPDLISGYIYKRMIKRSVEDHATAEAEFTASFQTNTKTIITLFNNTFAQGYKDFKIQVFGTRGIILYSDTEGLRVSHKNEEPLKKITIKDELADIKLGSSLVSSSTKYMARDFVKRLEGKQVDLSQFCSLEESLENMRYLEESPFIKRMTIL